MNYKSILILMLWISFFSLSLYSQTNSENSWKPYLKDVDGSKALILYDRKFQNKMYRTKCTQLLFINITLNNPTKNGLITKQESNEIYLIEDKILPFLMDGSRVFIGIITSHGLRTLFFYQNSKELNTIKLQELINLYNEHEIEYDFVDDNNWNLYDNLLAEY